MSAAAAAAAIRRRRQQEEEEMTAYTGNDLAGDWELKILRSATGAFKRPDYLKKVLEEKGQAGWVLVEKFDDGRIRLKRPARARQNDASATIDPYRTWVGMSESRVAIVAVGIALSALVLLLLIVGLVKG
jgi:hypothetical protein